MTSLCLSLLAKFSLCHSKVISLQLKNIDFFKKKKFLFGFDFWHLIFISLSMDLFDTPAWSLLDLRVFHKIEFSPIISSDSFLPLSLSFSPSKTPYMHVHLLMTFLRFHSLCPLQFFSFVFLWSIFDIVLSSHYTCRNVFELLWWCFIPVIVIFSSEKKSFGFLFLIFLAIYWYQHFADR